MPKIAVAIGPALDELLEKIICFCSFLVSTSNYIFLATIPMVQARMDNRPDGLKNFGSHHIPHHLPQHRMEPSHACGGRLDHRGDPNPPRPGAVESPPPPLYFYDTTKSQLTQPPTKRLRRVVLTWPSPPFETLPAPASSTKASGDCDGAFVQPHGHKFEGAA